MAAILACGPGAYLASLTAAVHMKLWRPPSYGHTRARATRTHAERRARDVTVSAGIPVTTVPRTLVDLSDVLTPRQLAKVIHGAVPQPRR
jgi:hypothetical protein